MEKSFEIVRIMGRKCQVKVDCGSWAGSARSRWIVRIMGRKCQVKVD